MSSKNKLESDSNERFNVACRLVKMNKSLAKNMTDDELGQLYGLYKQSTIGKCDITTPPNKLTDYKEYSKWKYWKKYDGLSKSDSMNEYADFVLNMHDKYAKN